MIGEYVVLKQIGQGAFGVIVLAKHQQTGKKVAIKISAESDINQEYEILKQLNDHPNIVAVFEVVKVPLAARVELAYTLGMVMQYVEGGDLVKYISKSGPLPEQVAMKFLVQILSALSNCHQKHIAHRDIKPDNILFDPNTGNMILCDFGTATHFVPNQLLHGREGSLLYCAPEILKDLPYSGPQVDIWSVGVVFYCLLSGQIPWEGLDLSEQLRNAVFGNYSQLDFLSRGCSRLLASMLSVAADARPTADQLLESLTTALNKYNCLQSLLNNHSQNTEDGSTSQISADGIHEEDGESCQSPPVSHQRYNLRTLKESELQKDSVFQVARVDVPIEILCKALEQAFETVHINFRLKDRKKSWFSGPCFKFKCKRGQSRFDIEICKTKEKKGHTKVILCKNIIGHRSDVVTLLGQLYYKLVL